jgi:hypothetical protein
MKITVLELSAKVIITKNTSILARGLGRDFLVGQKTLKNLRLASGRCGRSNGMSEQSAKCKKKYQYLLIV